MARRSTADTERCAQVLLPVAAVAMLTANKVLHKIAMVPMAHYVLFLAFMQTFGYVVVYGAFLTARTKCALRLRRA